jgi:SAM-dependent methyltransferase
MFWLISILLVFIICFAGVLTVGAPYLPTLKQQVVTALELAQLKPGQSLLELGCGDGKVVLAAAKQGIKVVGYEINPILALVAWLRTWRYRKHVKIVCADFWKVNWPEAEAIFVFLLPKYMTKLDEKIETETKKPIKLVSFAFSIPGKSKAMKKNCVYLYKYS